MKLLDCFFSLLIFFCVLYNNFEGSVIQQSESDPCDLCLLDEICVYENATKSNCVPKHHFETHNLKKRQTVASVCSANQCRYGECEILNLTSYKCHCLEGVTGTNCDALSKSSDPCTRNPCYGDSICVPQSNNQFRCNCKTGRAGPNCAGHTAPCQCKNGGLCNYIMSGVYSCSCPSDYGGYLCQYKLTNKPQENLPLADGQIMMVCSPGVCLNGGTCSQIAFNLAKCICKIGYSGIFCNLITSVVVTSTTTLATTTTADGSNKIRTITAATTTNNPSQVLCPSNFQSQCQNGGTCYVYQGTVFSCVCQPGFTGVFCNIISNPITTTLLTTTTTTTSSNVQSCPTNFPNPCQNGGICQVNSGFSISCICKPGFNGPFCNIQSQSLFCSSSPCNNGGVCNSIDSSKGYCTCPSNFKGLTCDIGLDCSSNNPCQNNQPCLLVSGSPKCICIEPFSGQYCT